MVKETERHAILITDEGFIHPVKVDRECELDSLQKLIGGYIEVIRLHEWLLIIDEEGRLKGRRLNNRASQLYGEEILGNAILVRNEDEDFGYFSEKLARNLSHNLEASLIGLEMNEWVRIPPEDSEGW